MSGRRAPREERPLGKNRGEGSRHTAYREMNGVGQGSRHTASREMNDMGKGSRHAANGVPNGVGQGSRLATNGATDNTGQGSSNAYSASASSSSSSSLGAQPRGEPHYHHQKADQPVASREGSGVPTVPRAPSGDTDADADTDSCSGAVHFGAPGSVGFRMLFLDGVRRVVSPWHDLPLFVQPRDPKTDAGVHPGAGSGAGAAGVVSGSAGPRGESSGGGTWLSVVCTTPGGSRLKHEVAFEPYTPLRVSVKRGRPAQFASGAPWNHGFLPRTYQDPEEHRVEVETLTMEHLAGNGMPLEVLDLAQAGASWQLGEVRQVRPLGAVALVRDEGLGWVVLGVGGSADVAAVESLAELEEVQQGITGAIVAWLTRRDCTEPGDKPAMVLGQVQGTPEAALRAIAGANASWQLLVDSEPQPQPWALEEAVLRNPPLLHQVWETHALEGPGGHEGSGSGQWYAEGVYPPEYEEYDGGFLEQESPRQQEQRPPHQQYHEVQQREQLYQHDSTYLGQQQVLYQHLPDQHPYQVQQHQHQHPHQQQRQYQHQHPQHQHQQWQQHQHTQLMQGPLGQLSPVQQAAIENQIQDLQHQLHALNALLHDRSPAAARAAHLQYTPPSEFSSPRGVYPQYAPPSDAPSPGPFPPPASAPFRRARTSGREKGFGPAVNQGPQSPAAAAVAFQGYAEEGSPLPEDAAGMNRAYTTGGRHGEGGVPTGYQGEAPGGLAYHYHGAPSPSPGPLNRSHTGGRRRGAERGAPAVYQGGSPLPAGPSQGHAHTPSPAPVPMHRAHTMREHWHGEARAHHPGQHHPGQHHPGVYQEYAPEDSPGTAAAHSEHAPAVMARSNTTGGRGQGASVSRVYQGQSATPEWDRTPEGGSGRKSHGKGRKAPLVFMDLQMPDGSRLDLLAPDTPTGTPRGHSTGDRWGWEGRKGSKGGGEGRGRSGGGGEGEGRVREGGALMRMGSLRSSKSGDKSRGVDKREDKKESPGVLRKLAPRPGEQEEEKADTASGRSGKLGRLLLLGGRRKSAGNDEVLPKEGQSQPERGGAGERRVSSERSARARMGIRSSGQEPQGRLSQPGASASPGVPPFPHSSSEGAQGAAREGIPRDSTTRDSATFTDIARDGMRDGAASGRGAAAASAAAEHEIEEEDFSFNADSSISNTTQRLSCLPTPPPREDDRPPPQERRRYTVGLSGASPAHPALPAEPIATSEYWAPWGRSRTGGRERGGSAAYQSKGDNGEQPQFAPVVGGAGGCFGPVPFMHSGAGVGETEWGTSPVHFGRAEGQQHSQQYSEQYSQVYGDEAEGAGEGSGEREAGPEAFMHALSLYHAQRSATEDGDARHAQGAARRGYTTRGNTSGRYTSGGLTASQAQAQAQAQRPYPGPLTRAVSLASSRPRQSGREPGASQAGAYRWQQPTGSSQAQAGDSLAGWEGSGEQGIGKFLNTEVPEGLISEEDIDLDMELGHHRSHGTTAAGSATKGTVSAGQGKPRGRPGIPKSPRQEPSDSVHGLAAGVPKSASEASDGIDTTVDSTDAALSPLRLTPTPPARGMPPHSKTPHKSPYRRPLTLAGGDILNFERQGPVPGAGSGTGVGHTAGVPGAGLGALRPLPLRRYSSLNAAAALSALAEAEGASGTPLDAPVQGTSSSNSKSTEGAVGRMLRVGQGEEGVLPEGGTPSGGTPRVGGGAAQGKILKVELPSDADAEVAASCYANWLPLGQGSQLVGPAVVTSPRHRRPKDMLGMSMPALN